MQSLLQPIIGPKKTVEDLGGRVAIVIGGAMGIGFEISRAFAQYKAKVIMINRKQEQGDEAIKQIKEESGQDTQVEWHGCDMGNLKQVQEVITRIRDKEDRLDLLILSAGINTNAYGETHDGIDRHFQVNWLGQFYATNILYPLIRKTSKIPDAPTPRIVWESSRMHRMADENIRFENLNEINDSSIDPVKLYGRTKLAIILGVKYGLRDRVIKPNGDNIYVLSVHPGAVNTLMQHQYKDAYPGLMGQMMTYVNMAFGRNPEQGSYSALYAALSPEVKEKGWNGWYLEDPGMEGKETEQASNPKLGTKLWELSHRMIKDIVGPDAIVPWDANDKA